MNGRLSPRRLSAPVFGWRDIGVGDIAFATLLTLAAIASSDAITDHNNPHHGLAAAAAVTLMTAPVVFARRAPVEAAGALAAGAALNWALIGHQVRCGAALPAVFYVAFMIGSRPLTRRQSAAGFGFLAINIACQAFSDPRLGAGTIGLFVPIALGFGFAGALLRRRNATAAQLRLRTAELREQREQNAALAVAAEQTRVADDLDEFLHAQVSQIAAAATRGQAALAGHPRRAEAEFIKIQETGRQTLTHMRGVVAGLHGEAPTDPQPVLAHLDRLLRRSAQAETYLHLSGDPRLLPPGVELSGYRIVEHLLLALDDEPAAQIDVGVDFGSATLALTVVGPAARHGEVRTAIAAATERASLHGGTLRTSTTGGRRETVVLLPLAASAV